MPQTSASELVFHAIADPNRRRLLDLLAAGASPAQELAGRFDISFAAVSQHLRVLLEAGLVTRRAAGRQRIYTLAPARLRAVDQWTANYRRFWQSRLTRLGEYLDSEQRTEKNEA
ncbi:MAG TPA: metalloregulator ArsR/SmtB family transcription factor [Candidatus Binataceae bacterium]|nr:metalloregulator ArsR/SmtB family transcription factor [Candidatus Binataceae bacterium]